MTNRDAEIKAERRRRRTDDLEGNRMNLAVDESRLDRNQYAYRFANDAGNRIFNLTKQDDWEIDPTEGLTPNNSGLGSGTAILADTDAHGRAVRTVLLRKKREYFEEDDALKQAHIDAQENELRRTPVAGDDGGAVYIKDNTRITTPPLLKR